MHTYPTRIPPYIGITDFMTRAESLYMLAWYEPLANTSIVPHDIMVGVMMSYKTLNKLPTKWTNAFPKSEDISSIFVPHPRALNTLHYADYTNTDVAQSLARAIVYGGPHMHALQLDMVWPRPHDLADALTASRRDVPYILQLGSNALSESHNNPREVLDRLKDYHGLVDGVLLDTSMGQGKLLDPDLYDPYLDLLYTELPGMRVAMAGGLGPNTMHTINDLVARNPDISIDAQSKLRPSGSALDPIEWSMRTNTSRARYNYMRDINNQSGDTCEPLTIGQRLIIFTTTHTTCVSAQTIV